MKHLPMIGVSLIAILAVIIAVATYVFEDNDATVVIEQNSTEQVTEIKETIEVDEDTSDEFIPWTIASGMIVEHGSNPMPVYQDDDRLVIAYENRATQLHNLPTEKAKFLETTDGEVWTAVESTGEFDYRPEPLTLLDGTVRRFIYMPDRGGVISQTSTDGGETFVDDEGLRLEIASDGEMSPRYFGVSTYFVDSTGGVVLLYNVTDEQGDIVVNRAYASDGYDFTSIEKDILDGTMEVEKYADPHTVVRENGEIWLTIMNQEAGAAPPAVRTGTIHGYRSTDDGKTFEHVGALVSWDAITEYEVYSLNDPKLIEIDGVLMVVCAAMIPDETSDSGYTWILVRAFEA